jgi:hypothetical protein
MPNKYEPRIVALRMAADGIRELADRVGKTDEHVATKLILYSADLRTEANILSDAVFGDSRHA